MPSSQLQIQERAPLVPDSQASHRLSVKASSHVKLWCCFIILLLVATSLVASLNLSRSQLKAHGNSSKRDESESRTEKFGFFIKCFLPLLGICAFVYLLRWVVVEETVAEAVLIHPCQPETVKTIRAIPWCLKLPHHLMNSPTTFFNLLFVIFSLLSVPCAIFELAEYCTHHGSTGFGMLAQAVKYGLIVAFVLCQLYFFWMHSRVCLQWKLDGAWLAFSVIISVNLSCWFFHTGSEIVKALKDGETDCNTSHTDSEFFQIEIYSLAESFGPFLSECFLMGAILSGTVLSNAGRWAKALQWKHFSGASVDEPMNYGVAGRFQKKIRKHGRKLFYFSLISGVVVCVIAIFKPKMSKLKCLDASSFIFYLRFSIFVPCYAAGIAICSVLLFASRLSRGARQQARSGPIARHTADRLMLWCTLVGMFVYRLQRIWRSLTIELSVAQGVTSLLNIVSSALQVCVIESILAGGISNLVRWQANAAAWSIIAVNALKWLVYANTFSLIMPDGNEDLAISLVLAMVAMPLQVFFCFHSIGCMYEFKGDMIGAPHHEPEGHSNPAYHPIKQEESQQEPESHGNPAYQPIKQEENL